MDKPNQQQNLAEFSRAVRESSLKRFRVVPEGLENWRITPESMSIADLAQHLIHADRWLFLKLADPNINIIAGNPGEVTVTRREQYDELLVQLVDTGNRRVELLRNMTDEDLSKRVLDDHYGVGKESSVWWLLVRANLDHEIHHRGALAVYLRVLKELQTKASRKQESGNVSFLGRLSMVDLCQSSRSLAHPLRCYISLLYMRNNGKQERCENCGRGGIQIRRERVAMGMARRSL